MFGCALKQRMKFILVLVLSVCITFHSVSPVFATNEPEMTDDMAASTGAAGESNPSDTPDQPQTLSSETVPSETLSSEAEPSEALSSEALAAGPLASEAPPAPEPDVVSMHVPDGGYAFNNGTITGLDVGWVEENMPEDGKLLCLELVIPQSIKGRHVSQIGDCAFGQDRRYGIVSPFNELANRYPNLRITSVDLSGAIYLTKIGDDAFYKPSGAVYSELSCSLVLPDSVNTLGGYAFTGQTGFLGELRMPDNLKTISEYNIFQGCTGFTSIDLNKVEEFKSNAQNVFQNCTGLKGTLTIPSTLKSLGKNPLFQSCGAKENGMSLEFGKGSQITEIPGNTFKGANLIGFLKIPEGVATVGYAAFQNTALTSVSFPGTLTSIGQSSFAGIPSLKEIKFAPSNENDLTIEKDAFNGHSAKVLDLPSTNIKIRTNSFLSTETILYLNTPSDACTVDGTPFGSNSLIVVQKENYPDWYDKLRSIVTYEMDVSFYDEEGKQLENLPPVTKLYNKSILYSKDEETQTWTLTDVAGLPDVPDNWDGWSHKPGGEPMQLQKMQYFTREKLYYGKKVHPEYIWFGTYPQSEATAAAVEGMTEGEGYFVMEWPDGKGGKITEYFLREPVRWRIVAQNGRTLTLLSESILDGQSYSGPDKYSTWENSPLRQWLNGEFRQNAFSEGEQARLVSVPLENAGTTDKVYLLSYESDPVISVADFTDTSQLLPDNDSSSYGMRRTSLLAYGTASSKYGGWWLWDLYQGYSLYFNQNGGLSATFGNITTGVRPMITITLRNEDILENEGTYADPYRITQVTAPPSPPVTTDPTEDEAGVTVFAAEEEIPLGASEEETTIPLGPPTTGGRTYLWLACLLVMGGGMLFTAAQQKRARR